MSIKIKIISVSWYNTISTLFMMFIYSLNIVYGTGHCFIQYQHIGAHWLQNQSQCSKSWLPFAHHRITIVFRVFFFSQWKLPDDPPCDISPTPYHFLLFHFFKPTHKFKSIQGWIARFDPLRPIIQEGGGEAHKNWIIVQTKYKTVLTFKPWHDATLWITKGSYEEK